MLLEWEYTRGIFSSLGEKPRVVRRSQVSNLFTTIPLLISSFGWLKIQYHEKLCLKDKVSTDTAKFVLEDLDFGYSTKQNYKFAFEV